MNVGAGAQSRRPGGKRYAIAAIGIVGLFTLAILDRQGEGRLTIESGEHELAIDFADNRLNFGELPGSLLSDP